MSLKKKPLRGAEVDLGMGRKIASTVTSLRVALPQIQTTTADTKTRRKILKRILRRIRRRMLRRNQRKITKRIQKEIIITAAHITEGEVTAKKVALRHYLKEIVKE